MRKSESIGNFNYSDGSDVDSATASNQQSGQATPGKSKATVHEHSQLAADITAKLTDPVVYSLQASIGHLSEKRTPIREASLEAIVKILSSKYSEQILETLVNYIDTLWGHLKRGIKRGMTPLEIGLSCKALALIMVYLDLSADDEKFLDLQTILSNVLRDNNDSFARAQVLFVSAYLRF